MQIYYEGEQASLFAPASFVGRMCPAPSVRETPKERTSGSSLRRSSELKYVVFQSLDLTPGVGNLLGESYWERISPWRGDASTLNTGVSPREEKESSLSQILQDDPPDKYSLTTTACLGILRRAFERGKALPETLKRALEIQAGTSCQAQRHGLCGDVTAAFSAGAGATAGGIGYSEQVAPTIKGSAGGNSMPSVLCLNDQGGSVMDYSEDMVGTLRAQTKGHEPLVFENHGIDARYTGPHEVSPTMSARYGTGGNNTPLVARELSFCITGNTVGREPQNGGNGLGVDEELAFTLTATDRHCVYSRQRVDVFKANDVSSTESARQSKDATDLVIDKLIRRLTPLECERLQGFPDGWTDIPGAADSARYKALGNSVAIPCVDYILQGMAMVLNAMYT